MEATLYDQGTNLIDGWMSSLVDSAPHSSNQPSINLPFQRWFKFKEAYSPKLVLDVVDSLGSLPFHIVDPFGGCGTTAITSQFLGISPTAIEVNPFLADLTESKLTNYNFTSLLEAKKLVFSAVDAIVIKDIGFYPESFVEPGSRGKWLYSQEVFSKILRYKGAVELIDDVSIRRLFRVILGSTLVPVSNIFISGKGRKYKQDWKNRPASVQELDNLFENNLNKALRDIYQFSGKSSSYTLLRGDCRARSKEFGEFDLSVFSPPYPNSFDYTDVYNIELWLLDYITSHSECRDLRTETLRSHVQVKRSYEFAELDSPILKDVHSQLNKIKGELWNPAIPDMVAAYFDDLYGLLSNMSERITRNGNIVMVVGDSAYQSIRIPVADILSEISRDLGFTTKQKNVVRRMRTSAQQGGSASLDETIIWITKN